jgi:hypothetical protein
MLTWVSDFSFEASGRAVFPVIGISVSNPHCTFKKSTTFSAFRAKTPIFCKFLPFSELKILKNPSKNRLFKQKNDANPLFLMQLRSLREIDFICA